MSFSEDPTQGATPGEDPLGTGGADATVDPTAGAGIGGQDPTQGDVVGEGDYEDPTEGAEHGSQPGEDPAG